MASLLDIIVQLFKIDQGLVSQYMNQGEVYALFYIFFFPTLFILLFIYIVTKKGFIGEQKFFRILVAIGIYAFIILNGWYNVFVNLSKFWIYMLFLLGFVYFLFSRGGTKGGREEAGKGGFPGFFEGAWGDVKRRVKGKVTGEEQLVITQARSAIEAYRNATPQQNPSFFREQARHYIDELHKMTKVGGIPSRVVKDLEQELKSVEKLRAKDRDIYKRAA